MNNRKAPPSLTFRGMADAREDYARLKTWLCNPAVRKWYGADDFPVPPSLEDVVKKYRVPSLLEEEVHPCFILKDGRLSAISNSIPSGITGTASGGSICSSGRIDSGTGASAPSHCGP